MVYWLKHQRVATVWYLRCNYIHSAQWHIYHNCHLANNIKASNNKSGLIPVSEMLKSWRSIITGWNMTLSLSKKDTSVEKIIHRTHPPPSQEISQWEMSFSHHFNVTLQEEGKQSNCPWKGHYKIQAVVRNQGYCEQSYKVILLWHASTQGRRDFTDVPFTC